MEAMKEKEAGEGGGRVVGGPVEGMREWQRCFAFWLRRFAFWLRLGRGAEGLTSSLL